jgi:beta-galactosidase/beta-glucuronidase
MRGRVVSNRSVPATVVVALALALCAGSGRAVAASGDSAGTGTINGLVAGVMKGLPPAPSAPPRPGPSAPAGPAQTGWRAKTPVLSTPWTAAVSPTHENGTYPRPQMTRAAWEGLNGDWQFAPARAGARPPVGLALSRRILVPFPMESALSGIGAHYENSFYRRTFTIPSSWSGRRVLLNFGAVDWQATVWVNGRRIGIHRGGYAGFSMDITRALHRGGTQEVILGVDAPVDRGGEPVGKQRLRPHGIWYTANSGIWQSVWLEPVPVAHIDSIRATPDVSHDTLSVTVHTSGTASDTIQAIAYQGRQPVASAQGSSTATLTLSMPNARLWSPTDPYLYGLTVRLIRGGRPIDAVGSYFGMRSISVASVDGVARVELNGQPTFMLGTLDQGYWPDGGYTAPTAQALDYDLLIEKALGFNAVRKHMKVEPQQWYYDTDRFGLLVWQDMPAMVVAKPTGPAQREFLRELHAIVDANIDHPSIVQWDPFNEGWGEFDPDQVTQDVHAWDPTRLVDTTSGYNHCTCAQPDAGDVLDTHSYPSAAVQAPSATQATAIGEFGGLALRAPGHVWPGRTFGYEREPNSQTLTNRYVDLLTQVDVGAAQTGLSGAIYTAALDVDDEVDGLITFDRRELKVTPASVQTINARAIADGSQPRARH